MSNDILCLMNCGLSVIAAILVVHLKSAAILAQLALRGHEKNGPVRFTVVQKFSSQTKRKLCARMTAGIRSEYAGYKKAADKQRAALI